MRRSLTSLVLIPPLVTVALVPAPVQAATVAVDAPSLALAIAADAATVVSAEYLNPAATIGTTATSPAVVADQPLAGFPRAGSSYAALSSGYAAPFVAGAPSGGEDLGQDDTAGVHGAYNFDTTVLRVDVDVPTGANCLAVDLLFATNEDPGFVQEAFLLERDLTTWTTPTAVTISAPDNVVTGSDAEPIAADSPQVTSAVPAGIDRDLATGLLTASAGITPGPHSLFFSIYDEQDHTDNSEVLLDNLRFSSVTDPATQCTQGVAPAITNVAAPVISGSALVGGTLTSSNGTWSVSGGGLGFTYQWLRDGTPIGGATAKTYSPTAADAGRPLAVRVTAANGSSVSATSPATAPVTVPPQPPVVEVLGTLTTSLPALTGRARVGRTLTAVPGAWGPGFVTYSFQWFRGTKAVRGATGRTFKLKKRDRGKTLHVVVTGSQPGFTTVIRASPSTKPVKGG